MKIEMKNTKFMLFLLTIPFLLVRMKLEHSKMKREQKRKKDQRKCDNYDLLVIMDTEEVIEIN